MAKFCKNCGSPLDAGERFCTNCGVQIAPAATPKNAAPAAEKQQQPKAQKAQHVSEYNYATDRPEKLDWKQFKPKLEIGKPRITFISKGKLIAIIVFIIILVIVALLQGCRSLNETQNKPVSQKPSSSSVITIHSPKTAMLKSSGTNGVKSYTLSDMDSKTLSGDDMRQLDALAKEIKAIGSCQVTVIGHADNTGTADVNEAVSKERARLVGNYLKKKGVANITTSGESYNHPVAGNDTAAGRAKNRRVEVYVSTVGKYNPYK